MSTTPEQPHGLEGMAAAAGDAAGEVAPEMRLPSSILPMPSSMMSSISSWWNLSPAQTAEAELFLVRKSGYFGGATIGNASACTVDGPDALSTAYRLVSESAKEAQPLAPGPAKFFTVGTQCASDGKVGCIRLVDIGAPPAGTSREGVLSRLGLRHHPRQINTLEIGTPVPRAEQDPHEQKVVLVHGYAAGLAFFYRNMQMFGSLPNSRFFALDWLGMGRSSRPPYALPPSKARSAERVEAAESYFLASLEQWREKMQIDKMVLVGHSLGGYLSVAYALRYPERVERLVLVSPVGIPEGSWQPAAASERLAESEAESDDAASDHSDSSGKAPMPPRRLNTRTLSMLGWLWDRNVSIFGLLRSTSFFAPWLVSGYTRRRFANIPPEELQCMHAYCHGIFAGRGSSEYCCTYSWTDPVSDILAPGAYARSPLIHRIDKLKMPTLFLYGDSDWMDIRGGQDAQRRLRDAGNLDTRVLKISKAGHHLYLDNPRRVNEALAAFLLRRRRALMQLVRIRSKDGQFRIAVDAQDDARVLVDKALETMPDADADTLKFADGPHGAARPARELVGSTLATLGIKHGDLLYASYAPRAAPADEGPPAPSEAARAPAAASARPWEHVVEDDVDQYWETQRGTIARARDPQFCRHGDKGMCDYCMPLEPYDAGYHASHNIKHLSFHAFLRKQNIAAGASSASTFVPPLEEASYAVQVPCPSGQHPPWPAGVCTKCQPSAITLQRQPYRMVDHVEFASPALIERLLDIWRKTNVQRFGFLIGRYAPYTEVPMGVKAVVEAIHEPPQQGEVDGLSLGIPWAEQADVERLAQQCGLQIIGMVYTDLEAADPTHSDARKAGLVACKRHMHSFFLSGAEALFAAQLQSANRAASRFSRSGHFNSRFVTCILTGNAEGVVEVAAYQVSEQAMGMVDADMIEASVEPTTVRVKPSEGTRYVPEVFYRYKNAYNIDVKESAKPTFPVEYLLVNVTHGFPTAPNPRFLSESFPIENRPGVHDQDLGAVCRALTALDAGALLPGADTTQHEARLALVRFLSDWHLLAFLQHSGVLRDDEMKIVCDVATSHSTGAPLDALLATSGWSTLVTIAAEHAPPPAASEPAPTDAHGDGGDAASTEGIACPHCTFVNPPGASDCEVCGLPLH